ncbi:MAG TPA: hypothetical protein VET88_02990 [Gammaproteobacteria bacterium]|nr:hypothetical protein [Gammaproteobacteria bacterium]
MKTQPELEAMSIYHDPSHPDSQAALPALQLYDAGQFAPEQRHDHILRAALLAGNTCAGLKR